MECESPTAKYQYRQTARVEHADGLRSLVSDTKEHHFTDYKARFPMTVSQLQSRKHEEAPL